MIRALGRIAPTRSSAAGSAPFAAPSSTRSTARKDKRKYQERWETLVKHGFNPVTDLRRNLDGVIELAGNKPAMEQDFDRYFRQRDEDANIRVG